jgi:hypothetical protein
VESTSNLRAKAARCRRLAEGYKKQGNQVVVELLALARQYDQQADAVDKMASFVDDLGKKDGRDQQTSVSGRRAI